MENALVKKKSANVKMVNAIAKKKNMNVKKESVSVKSKAAKKNILKIK
jgi:hypothetical protein